MLRVFTQSLKVVTIAALSVVVLATGVWAFSYAAELARPSDAGEPVMLTVFEDQTDVEVADELAAQGLIRSTLLFQGQFKLSGGALIPGTYTLRKGMSVPQIVDRITGAAPAEDVPAQAAATAPESFDVTIPEAGVLSKLRRSMGGLAAKAARRPSWTPSGIDRSQFDFLADLPPDASLEGYLFPDTYRFDANDPVLNVVTMLTNFGNKYTPEMRQRTQQMGLTIHDVVTIASLVERSADPRAADRRGRLPEPLGAGLAARRGSDGPVRAWHTGRMVAEALEMISFTTARTTPIKGGAATGSDCEPWICLDPGVLFPNDTPYMYFVAKGDTGEHAFAVTPEEQAENVELYLNSGG